MKTDASIKLELPSSCAYLNLLSGCIAELLSHADWLKNSAETVYDVQLVAQEIGNDIVELAYGNDASQRITINLTLSYFDKELIIEFEDRGHVFEAASHLGNGQMDHSQMQGNSLYFAQQLMDSVTYTTDSNANRCHLSKRL